MDIYLIYFCSLWPFLFFTAADAADAAAGAATAAETSAAANSSWRCADIAAVLASQTLLGRAGSVCNAYKETIVTCHPYC